MNSVLVLLAFGTVTFASATATYTCVCNRDTDVNFQVFDLAQSPVGYLYPNECKAFVNESNTDQGWFSIQFNQETAYIKEQDKVVLEECTGSSSEDTEPTELPITLTMFVTSNYTFSLPTLAPSGNTSIHVTPGKTTLSPAFLGHVHQCPSYVVQGAKSNGFLLTQRGHSCYEVCQTRVSWTHAHMLCTERGGHLVSIHSDNENSYLHRLLQHSYNHRVWIGLHDREHEERFEWTTGEKVVYTNWIQHHRQSANHTHEDCVLMLQTGFWDDVQCGGNNLSTESGHMTAAYICEYKTHNSGSFIVG
ncbi:aggrecan core protein-like isoform X2 [Mercenaria mercenaria]|nr:aggrecan core protein-like isoform X2 [Mercenaria mercenaria]XP_045189365.1 aggrecan core protein-like isoform X2 [Mercenaria mercenaria]XP_045189366.1 aggrecan core protein-like isoform X2 [Mercenaria mercenaria]